MKIFKTVILSLLLVFAINTVAMAEDTKTSGTAVLYDGADILTDSDETDLYERAATIAKKHNLNIIIYTEERFITYAEGTAKEVYLSYFDENTDGILYYVNMTTRDYYFLTCGDARRSLSDNYGLVKIENKVVDDLSDAVYYTSFDKFLNMVDKFEKKAESGMPYSFINPYRTPVEIIIRIVIAIVIGVVVALLVSGRQKSKLKPVKPEPLAKNYIAKDGFVLRKSKDSFMFKNVTKIPKPQSSGSSGGSRSSGGGGSFGGRGGKF